MLVADEVEERVLRVGGLPAPGQAVVGSVHVAGHALRLRLDEERGHVNRQSGSRGASIPIPVGRLLPFERRLHRRPEGVPRISPYHCLVENHEASIQRVENAVRAEAAEGEQSPQVPAKMEVAIVIKTPVHVVQREPAAFGPVPELRRLERHQGRTPSALSQAQYEESFNRYHLPQPVLQGELVPLFAIARAEFSRDVWQEPLNPAGYQCNVSDDDMGSTIAATKNLKSTPAGSIKPILIHRKCDLRYFPSVREFAAPHTTKNHRVPVACRGPPTSN
mmetsp:Transcript_67492/g.218023  ORF Transcript_67492/g.218023 Transcript_67492/m.218023 type:complete len:277 (+) Transcript_67492:97-927(+)